MKKPILLALLFTGWLLGMGQKHDYVWLSGYDSKYGYSKDWGFYFGASVLDFNYSPRKVYYDSIGMNFDRVNVSLCDSNGNLLFYSNGIYIANSLDEKIKNSDSLNAGWFQFVQNTETQTYGYTPPQGMICVPGGNNQFYLIHSLIDQTDFGYGCTQTLVTLLDMNLNAGHGEVVYKNRSLINALLDSEIQATRHGNGKDWWILVQKNKTNCYYRLLATDTGIHLMPDLTCAGREIPEGSWFPLLFPRWK